MPRREGGHVAQGADAFAGALGVDPLNRAEHAVAELAQFGAGQQRAQGLAVLGPGFEDLGENRAGALDDFRPDGGAAVEVGLERAANQRGRFRLAGDDDIGGAGDGAHEDEAGDVRCPPSRAGAPQPVEREAGAEAHAEDHRPLPMPEGQFFDEVVELSPD